MDSADPETSTIRSVDWGSISLDATMRAPELSWIERILAPPFPMTEPMRRWEMRRRTVVVVAVGVGVKSWERDEGGEERMVEATRV